jgi:predicted amidohydrolase
MRTVRIAAAQTPEFREDIDAALNCAEEMAIQAGADGALLLVFPEGFLQGYLTDEQSARRVALDLASPPFAAVLDRFPKTGPMIIMGLIEIDGGRLFNTAIVVENGVVIGRYRKTHLLEGERAFAAGNASPVFEGASLIVCCANNMMGRQKAKVFKELHNAARGARCRETGLWLVSADVTGERDGRVSWGPTAVLNPHGQVMAQLPLNAPGLLVFDIPAEQPESSEMQKEFVVD